MPARIQVLDYIRGLSILGILMVNAIAFAQPFEVYSNPSVSLLPLSQADKWVWWLTETFFKDKFITVFTLLFGISMYLVGRDTPPNAPLNQTPLFRRLAWLSVFGLIHGALIWHGDILLHYAITGALFWRWREATAKNLLIMGLFLYLAGAAVMLAPEIGLSVQGAVAGAQPDTGPIITAMRGSFTDSLTQNMATWAKGEVPEVVNYLPTTLGLMMIGLGLFKSGFLKGDAATRTYVMWIGASAACLCLIGWQSWQMLDQGFPFPEAFGIFRIANTLLCLPVALGYTSALILFGRLKIGPILLYPLACAGRMAFTNYLVQSLVMTAIFYGGRDFGLSFGGHFGEMNHAALIPIIAAIWAGQLVFSTIWMSLLRYGPFEWGWRCLTYARWMPILYAKAAA